MKRMTGTDDKGNTELSCSAEVELPASSDEDETKTDRLECAQKLQYLRLNFTRRISPAAPATASRLKPSSDAHAWYPGCYATETEQISIGDRLQIPPISNFHW